MTGLYHNISYAIPPSFTAHYYISKANVAFSKSRITLLNNPNSESYFESQTQAKSPFHWIVNDKVFEKSIWKINNNKIRSQKYIYNRAGKKKQKQITLLFNWDKSQVLNNIGGKNWAMPIPDPTYDKLLTQLMLMHDLSQGKTEIKYTVADGGTLKHYTYRVIGKEIIHTKIGRTEAIKVKRQKENLPPDITFWFSPQHHFVPLKMERMKKGIIYYVTIQKLDWN